MKPVRRGPRRRAPKHPATPGERIWAVRELLGYTQPELATRLGVTQATVSAWEKGVALPSGGSWLNLCRVLHMSREALERGKGFRLPDPDTLRISDNLDTEELVLPPHPPGAEVLKLDHHGLSLEALSLKQAQAALKQAVSEGRPVWVVLG